MESVIVQRMRCQEREKFERLEFVDVLSLAGFICIDLRSSYFADCGICIYLF